MTNPKVVSSRNSYGEGVTVIMGHPGTKFEKTRPFKTMQVFLVVIFLYYKACLARKFLYTLFDIVYFVILNKHK